MLTLTHCSGFGGGGFIKPFVVTLGSSQSNVSLSAKLTALGWNGTEPVDVTVTVPSGVLIGAVSYALTISALPGGSPPVKLVNAGRIQGAGGSGGTREGSGGSGGHALLLGHPVLLANSGVIAGGGGGGGGGEIFWGGGGGGGAGNPGGSGGSGGISTGSVGGSGSPYGGGGGGAAGRWEGGEGESGYGSAGANGGAPGSYGGSVTANWGLGGVPGAWVVGYAYLTIVSNTGTLAGATL